MKKLLPLLLLALLVSSCGKKETSTLKVYNTEAFAYEIGDGSYELNATTQVKGFKQNENGKEFTASLAYQVDLVKPNGTVVKGLVNKTEKKAGKEKMSDTQLEAQFDIDSTYGVGTYKVIFRVRDVFSEQADSSSAEFKIGVEDM
jgi:ABC-type thiamine transport system substrate-binding protein